MIRIYGKATFLSFRCLWMAEETGVPDGSDKGSTAARPPRRSSGINPNGHVPALGTTCGSSESLAINLYLARRYGGELWPARRRGRGAVFPWSIWA